MLEKYGVAEPGATIAVVMRNRPLLVASTLDTFVRARCLVPISSLQAPQRIADDVVAQRPAVVLADAEDWASGHLREATASCAAVGLSLRDSAVAVEYEPESAVESRPRDGVAIWMPTSGTTGPPKRTPITYRDLSIGFDRVKRYAQANQRAAAGLRLSTATIMSCTPLVHIAGLWELLQFAVEGRRLVLLDRFEPESWAEAVAEHRPVATMLPPAALSMLLDADIEPVKLHSLRAILCGTAALSPELEERFTARFGICVLSTYGATEFPGGLAGWTLEDKQEHGAEKRGSVGRARPGIRLRAVDERTHEPVGPGTVGLLEVQSAQTAARGIEGWVTTTDLGRFDADGFLWITGRADGAINRGGFKVLPEAVESVLAQHPAVRGVGVVGLPDARLGQVPVAAVELDGPCEPEAILTWARERLLKYQVPTRVVVVDALPRTPSMKVSRAQLLELLRSHVR
jgi:acyl-CoA synthetase (AMP-forming)/AMP-acid ligase II